MTLRKSLVIVALVIAATVIEALAMPMPALRFKGTENYTIGAAHWVRYKLAVLNWAHFPAPLFTPAPALPPCGANPNSARAWVDIHNGTAPYARIYGFCALGSPSDLKTLWFAMPEGTPPPNLVFIKITDRQTGEVKSSNRVATH